MAPGLFDKDLGRSAGRKNDLDRSDVTLQQVEGGLTGSTAVFRPETERIGIGREVRDLKGMIRLGEGEVWRVDDDDDAMHLGVEVAQHVDDAGFIESDAP